MADDFPNLIADPDVRRALASEIVRELLLNSKTLRPLIKDIVLEVIVHYEAVARVERCQRIVDLFQQAGFSLWVHREDGSLCHNSGLPADLKALFEMHRLELHDYLKDKYRVAKAANDLRSELTNGSTHQGNGLAR